MRLSEDIQHEMALRSLASISNICKLYKVNFLALPQGQRKLILDVFLAGVREVVEMMEEYEKV